MELELMWPTELEELSLYDLPKVEELGGRGEELGGMGGREEELVPTVEELEELSLYNLPKVEKQPRAMDTEDFPHNSPLWKELDKLEGHGQKVTGDKFGCRIEYFI